MTQQKNSVMRLLNELNSREVKDTFNYLSKVLESLETKNDPDRIEIEIVDNMYQTLEKMNILENSLRQYIRGVNNVSLPGNKLSDLYEK